MAADAVEREFVIFNRSVGRSGGRMVPTASPDTHPKLPQSLPKLTKALQEVPKDRLKLLKDLPPKVDNSAKEKFSKKDKKIFNELSSNHKDIEGKDLTYLMDSYNIKSIIKSDCLKYIECSRDLISKTNLQQTSKKKFK